jgi:hypothetical protein
MNTANVQNNNIFFNLVSPTFLSMQQVIEENLEKVSQNNLDNMDGKDKSLVALLELCIAPNTGATSKDNKILYIREFLVMHSKALSEDDKMKLCNIVSNPGLPHGLAKPSSILFKTSISRGKIRALMTIAECLANGKKLPATPAELNKFLIQTGFAKEGTVLVSPNCHFTQKYIDEFLQESTAKSKGKFFIRGQVYTHRSMMVPGNYRDLELEKYLCSNINQAYQTLLTKVLANDKTYTYPNISNVREADISFNNQVYKVNKTPSIGDIIRTEGKYTDPKVAEDVRSSYARICKCNFVFATMPYAHMERTTQESIDKLEGVCSYDPNRKLYAVYNQKPDPLAEASWQDYANVVTCLQGFYKHIVTVITGLNNKHLNEVLCLSLTPCLNSEDKLPLYHVTASPTKEILASNEVDKTITLRTTFSIEFNENEIGLLAFEDTFYVDPDYTTQSLTATLRSSEVSIAINDI